MFFEKLNQFDPEVYASKTIYPTADENYFEIELKV